MDVRAILMIGGTKPGQQENFGGIPFACLDVLGRPLVERMLQRLRQFGVSASTIVSSSETSNHADPSVRRARLCAGVPWTEAPHGQFWQTTENVFNQYAEEGAELVIAVRAGALRGRRL